MKLVLHRSGGIDVDQASQQISRQFASDTIQAFQPRMFDT
jgi:hypothetical protein